MGRFPLVFLISALLSFGVGCTYQKILKNGTPEEKLTAAKKYYNKEDYARALPLLDDLLGVYKRKAEAEEIYYYYAYTHYGMGDFLTASYNFKNFAENYPRSKFTEEAAFMSAKCAYHQSFPFYLDQTNTTKAIDKIQLFINKYPSSVYVADGNKLIDELRTKLHKKAYTNAMLYYKMANYKSAVVAFKNAVADYPDIPEKEELEFLIVKASYQYAQQSFLSSQIERYNTVLEEAELYMQGESQNEDHSKKVEEMVANTKLELDRLSKIPVAVKKS